MISCATSASPILVLCCAEERIQVVLGAHAGLMFAEEILCPGQSIRHLPTAIDRALRLHALDVKDLAGIACVRGPGSFTGLRIAHATMYGLARPFDLPMAGLEYHTVLATQILAAPDQEAWLATYARKGHVYLQGFANGQPLENIRPLLATEAAQIVAARSGHTLLAGSGVRKNPDLQSLPECSLLPPVFDTPSPTALLHAALAAPFAAQTPAPLYLRKSDAEDNLEAIARARGITTAAARQHIFDFE